MGAADPRPRAPGRPRGRRRRGRRTGRRSARRPRARSSSPRRSPRRMPSVEMLRMTSSGTEASMSAVRLARAVTGRDKVLKFAGAYHGHVDGLLAEAGSGLATQALPASPGVPAAAAAATVVVGVERPGRRRGGHRRARLRRHPRRALSGEHGARRARPGIPRAPARASRRDRRAAGLRRGHHRLPGQPRRGPGAHGRDARPHRAGQDHRRRACPPRPTAGREPCWSGSRPPATSTRPARSAATRWPSRRA